MIHRQLAYADRSPARTIYVESSWSLVGWRKSRNVFFCSLPCSRVGTVADSWLRTLVRQVHTLGGMGIFVRNGLVERVGRANRDIDLTVLLSSTSGWRTRAARGRAASRPRAAAAARAEGKRLPNDVTNDCGSRARAPDPIGSDRTGPGRIGGGVARLAAAVASTDRPTDGLSERTNTSTATWLILPVVICLSQRLSHACLSTYLDTVKPRMAH